MKLRIITKDRALLSVETDRVILPGALGQMEVLPGHAKLISTLKEGEIEFFNTAGKNKVDIISGLVEVADDKVTALVETTTA